jgi:HMG (high mobility group) box
MKPRTSYILFCIDYRPKLYSKFPNMSPQDITRELGKKWKTLDKKTKQSYQIKAQQEKEKKEKEKEKEEDEDDEDDEEDEDEEDEEEDEEEEEEEDEEEEDEEDEEEDEEDEEEDEEDDEEEDEEDEEEEEEEDEEKDEEEEEEEDQERNKEENDEKKDKEEKEEDFLDYNYKIDLEKCMDWMGALVFLFLFLICVNPFSINSVPSPQILALPSPHKMLQLSQTFPIDVIKPFSLYNFLYKILEFLTLTNWT